MEPYKRRMVREYQELKERYEKLHHLLVLHDAGKLTFDLTSPYQLLVDQASVMGRYLYILEVRAEIEHVDLNADLGEEGTES